ncbi:hypothetical protein QBC40DRAFT_231344 [Triangularia verruculosa]|uniref:Uncharacterized protein n=1 Tax=Triangularia verruculosa TaxID=2587418 RepID=A0AAN6XBS0_9PEZI|nr:hypothetical protein QBC40DRAFT_231344 [Triangularia verruculosa]
MRAFIQTIICFLLGLHVAVALVIPVPLKHSSTPRRRDSSKESQSSLPPTQYKITDFYGQAACHNVLTTCRVDSDCCPGLQCGNFDGEMLCTPHG